MFKIITILPGVYVERLDNWKTYIGDYYIDVCNASYGWKYVDTDVPIIYHSGYRIVGSVSKIRGVKI